ncbi:MAG: HDOD domain-containing protein [candidate division Zixibacteria bacterium]|nr:HDOD domain-containing protein [candidate division Zixibacteria bacterium]
MIAEAIDNKVKRVVSSIRNLPTPPIVFHQIQKVIGDPNVSAAHVASILAEDPAMSAKVLRLTNSSFYGLAREVESVKQAVVVIGFEAIKNLVLSASVLDMFKGKNIDQEYHDRFWRHSLSTAFCSRTLARKLNSHGMVDPDAAFSAGLLHDVGKLVISCFLEEEYLQFKQERSEDKDSPDFVIEEGVLGYNHAQIGGFLGEQWKIPQKLMEAISYHHHPQLHESDSPVAFIVHLANHVSKKTFADDYRNTPAGVPEPQVMEYMGVTEDDLDGYSELLREEYLKAETFMQMAGLS